jgi:hypothetical protein
MKGHLRLACATGAVVAVTAVAGSAFAQQTTVVEGPPPRSQVAEAPAYVGPNRPLIGTGLITFALSYIPAVVVAGESSQPADHHLYVPVVGPWLNLADRPACGPDSVACDTETTNKVLIAVDGVFQGIGALSTVVGLLTPEPETVASTAKREPPKPKVHISPARLGVGGYGVAAFGQF